MNAISAALQYTSKSACYCKYIILIRALQYTSKSACYCKAEKLPRYSLRTEPRSAEKRSKKKGPARVDMCSQSAQHLLAFYTEIAQLFVVR
jgi:hypothetical protein